MTNLTGDLVDTNQHLSEQKNAVACWYYLPNQKMANGKKFDPKDATIVASLKFPLGTKLSITNPKNGKTITCTVSDKGPHVKGRDLDLCKAAAAKIDIIEVGVAEVKVSVLFLPQRS